MIATPNKLIATTTPGISWTTYGDKTYLVSTDGTYFHPDTPHEVIKLLEAVRRDHRKVRIHYGYTEKHCEGVDGKQKTPGRDWHEENDVTGTIGRSMGPVKIPLIIAPNEDGGPGLLEHCIVRIRLFGIKQPLSKAIELYQHPNYHTGQVVIKAVDFVADKKHYTAAVLIDGETHANFSDEAKARRWCEKMGLTPA